jgi:hypothetical protein
MEGISILKLTTFIFFRREKYNLSKNRLSTTTAKIQFCIVTLCLSRQVIVPRLHTEVGSISLLSRAKIVYQGVTELVN